MFEALENRDVVSWGSMIAAYADSGDWMMAWNCLENMNKSELKPDATIFASILVSCGHAGMLDAGLAFFRLITSCYGLEPALLHYSLLIDLMARSGHLALALDLTETMPCIPKSFLWTSILTECVLYGETKLAYECFDEAFRLEPSDASGYVLILNALTNGRLIMDDGTEDRGKTKNESVEREHHDVVEPPSLKHTDLSENVECNFERCEYTGFTSMHSFCNSWSKLTITTVCILFTFLHVPWSKLASHHGQLVIHVFFGKHYNMEETSF
jgi:pentatricopeptide repeat protein